MVKYFFGYQFTIFFLCIALLALSPSLRAEEKQVVSIGVIFPLTGPMSSFGEDMSKAIPLFEKKFNSASSKYTFRFLLEDGKFGQGNAAITAAKKLVAVDGARFLVLGSSGETLQVAPYAEGAKVLAVAGFASHPDVKKSGDYIFRTYVDTERGIRLVAEDMLKKDIGRVAVISEESSFTLAIQKLLHTFLAEKIVFSESYGFGDADFNAIITKAKSRDPQAYYINASTPANFIALVRQLRANGIQEPFYTFYTPSLPEVRESLGKQLQGTTFLDFPAEQNESQVFKNFLTEFEEHTKKKVQAAFNFRTNYNAIKVVVDGIMAVGPDPEKVKDFLYAYDQPSATGRLRFDSNGDARDLDLVLKVAGAK
jgi:branched-chain amino acid transport system substrate-binding protein